MADSVLILANASAIAGIGLLRLAWSRKQRSHILNGAGWAALLAGVLLSGIAEGAWGIAVMSITAMLAAFALLAVAGLRAPAGRTRGSTRRVGLLPERGEPRRIGRRVVTFLLTIVAGFAVSVGLGLAVRTLGGALGWGESNANVAALFSVPLVWSALVFALLMQRTRRAQVATLLACCVPVVPVLLSGVVQ